MKKFVSMLAIVILTGMFWACKEEDLVPDGPTITAPSLTTVQIGTSTTITFDVATPGGFGSVTPSGSGGTFVVTGQPEEGSAGGNVVVSFTAGDVSGAGSVSVLITDRNGKAATQTAVINITGLPQKTIVEVESSTEGVGTTTWTADNIYVLKGFVFVNSGQTLTIEPGTVIKGLPGQGSGASALIVARGGKIMAEGTSTEPIIFTGLADDLEGSVPAEASSLWGGLIILGKASNNNLSTSGVVSIEGIPTEEERGKHGGDDDADNSGVLRYVSIRHGGSVIGADNEINGLTLGSVGTGTVIENIEVIANFDDGIEFFGGTVNVKNVVISYAGDDGLDIDLGYRGNIQGGIVWHTGPTLESSDPNGAELDGGDGANETAAPFATPKMANLTFMFDKMSAPSGMNRALYYRDNFRGSLYNSIIVGHDAKFDIERRIDLAESSYDGFGLDFEIKGNIFFGVSGVTSGNSFVDIFQLSDDTDATLESDVEATLASDNGIVDPAFGTGSNKFKPSAAEVKQDLATLPAGLDARAYKGGVDPDATTPFFANWTLTWEEIQ